MSDINVPLIFKAEMEKTATYEMPQDVNLWDEEVIKHLHEEHPELTEEDIEVVFKKTDAKKGYGYGFVALGKKGIIKVESRELTPQEVNKIALIAPRATLNIIKDFEVVEKRRVEVPDRVEGIVRCFNPNCVTNRQAVSTCFDVVGTSPMTLRCIFCERMMSGQDIILK